MPGSPSPNCSSRGFETWAKLLPRKPCDQRPGEPKVRIEKSGGMACVAIGIYLSRCFPQVGVGTFSKTIYSTSVYTCLYLYKSSILLCICIYIIYIYIYILPIYCYVFLGTPPDVPRNLLPSVLSGAKV